MTPDLWALLAVLVLAIVQLTSQSIVTLRQAGPQWVAGPRDTSFEVKGRGGRIFRAHRNLLEILPQFFASLFVVHAANVNAELTIWGAWLFFFARLFYVPAYLFGPAGLRSIFWQTGQIGIIIILSDIFW